MSDRPNIKIRPMVEDDLAAVNDVDLSISGKGRVSTWPFSFGTYWGIYGTKVVVFVAEIDGTVRGFLSGSFEHRERSKSLLERPHEAASHSRDEEIGWIEMMGIRPDCWHMGIGTRLIEAFRVECKKRNASMRIIARDDDAELAAFLQNVGFSKSKMVTYEMAA